MNVLARLITAGAMPAFGLPITFWIIAALVLSLAGDEGLRRVQVSGLRADVQTEKAGRADDRRIVAEATAKKEKANADRTYRVMEIQGRNDDAAAKKLAQAQRARDSAVAAGDALQLRVEALLRSVDRDGRTQDSTAQGQCAPASTAAHLLADVQHRMDEAGRQLADYADRARIAGEQCQSDYDSLTLKATTP